MPGHFSSCRHRTEKREGKWGIVLKKRKKKKKKKGKRGSLVTTKKD